MVQILGMKPLTFHFAIASALAIGICGARAAGVAMLKEQTFHEDSSATAVAFSKIVDSDGPYLRIVCGDKNIDILRSNLAARIEVPEGIPESITDEKDLTPLRLMLADVKKFTARYPQSAPLLETPALALENHISHFNRGEIRFEGVWYSKSKLHEIRESRRHEFERLERIEVEKRIFEASQRDQGLELHNGKWLTKQQIEAVPPGSQTDLSNSIEPLASGDLQGAKYAVQNLLDLAKRQSGAPKVRTERLIAVIRNLFFAEVCLNQQIIASVGEINEAAKHEQRAKEWLIPNGLGTVRKEESMKSRGIAKQLRQHSAERLAHRRKELVEKLQEADGVTEDFFKLREDIVVLALSKAVRVVSARHFTRAEYRSAFPETSLVSIREKIRANRNATSGK
jgi:hypothetical protein